MVSEVKVNLAAVMIISWVVGALGYCDTSDNRNIHCETTLAGEYVTLDMDLVTCQEIPYLSLDIRAGDIVIHEDVVTDLSIPLSFWGNIEVSLTPSDSSGDILLSLKFTALHIIPITILQETINDPDCNTILFWFNSQGVGVFVGIGIGGLVFSILCCLCCYCCCCRRKKTDIPTTYVVHSGVNGFAPCDSYLPYTKHENKPV